MQKTDDEGVFTTKSSILDEIQTVVSFLQMFNDLVGIAMVGVSPTAVPAIASEKIATKSVFTLIARFIINLAVMQALPYVAQLILEKIFKISC